MSVSMGPAKRSEGLLILKRRSESAARTSLPRLSQPVLLSEPYEWPNDKVSCGGDGAGSTPGSRSFTRASLSVQGCPGSKGSGADGFAVNPTTSSCLKGLKRLGGHPFLNPPSL